MFPRKLKRHIYECDFDGVTGHITIQKRSIASGKDTGGNREGIVEIRQWKPSLHDARNYTFVTVGRYVPTHHANQGTGAKFQAQVELRTVNGAEISDGSERKLTFSSSASLPDDVFSIHGLRISLQ